MPSGSKGPRGPFSSSSRNSSVSSFERWIEQDQDEPEDDDDGDSADSDNGRHLQSGHQSIIRSLVSEDDLRERVLRQKREGRIRLAMLGCACCLSVGSHFGSYIIGPIKTRLKTSESGFASLVSASQLVNTITPLISGFVVPKFGAARCGLAATGTVLVGQLIVCWAERGEIEDSVGGMVVGLLVFGLGISPLAVVQESIILASKREASQSVARSVAAGLLLGKSASFIAAFVAEPLASISVRLPFITSAALSLFSFLACVAYALLERRLPPTKALPLEPTGHHKAMDKPIQLKELPTLGDPLWIYIAVCAIAGLWSTTIHLSTSLLATLYGIGSTKAATVSSAIPFSAIVLYPLLAHLIDKRPRLLSTMYIGVSIFALIGFVVLRWFTSIIPIFASIVPLALGIGPAPLLLVVVVPRLVERDHVSTALGIHKSSEMAGAVLVQGSTSWLLSSAATKLDGSQSVITLFLAISLVQLALVIFWWQVIRSRETPVSNYKSLASDEAEPGEVRLWESIDGTGVMGNENSLQNKVVIKESRSDGETARGRIAVWALTGLVVSSWSVFIYNLSTK
ncbi:MFS general substrate transporter [Meredithblackwellia eburnea MCA 4105]